VLGTVLEEADVTRKVTSRLAADDFTAANMTDERAVRDNADEIQDQNQSQGDKGGLIRKHLAHLEKRLHEERAR